MTLPARLSLDTSLSEFQRQLDAAIAASEVSTEAFVAMAVDEHRWLLDLSHLTEASMPPPISRTGRSPAGVLGIASFRGQVYTVMDMRQLLAGQPTAALAQGWATPLSDRWGGALALLWPQMVGLVDKSELAACPKPEIPDAAGRWVRAAWRDSRGQQWLEFDVAAFTSSIFAQTPPPAREPAQEASHG